MTLISLDDPWIPVSLYRTKHFNFFVALFLNSVNKKSLEEIESSLFVLALDQKNPETPTSMNRRTVAALQMLHGLGSYANSGNRWFDKTIQVILGRLIICDFCGLFLQEEFILTSF